MTDNALAPYRIQGKLEVVPRKQTSGIRRCKFHECQCPSKLFCRAAQESANASYLAARSAAYSADPKHLPTLFQPLVHELQSSIVELIKHLCQLKENGFRPVLALAVIK